MVRNKDRISRSREIINLSSAGRGKPALKRPRKNNSGSKLKIIPLGGLEQIGMNITAFEYEDSIVVVDCGLAFPEDDMPGNRSCNSGYYLPEREYFQGERICDHPWS